MIEPVPDCYRHNFISLLAAVRELYETAADMATDIATRIVRKEISGPEYDRVIQESIDDLRKLMEGGHEFRRN